MAPAVAASSGSVYDCRALPLPSGIAPGHLLVAVTTGWWAADQAAAYNANPAAGWNPPAGWTFGAGQAFTAVAGQMLGFAWWYRYATGSESGSLAFSQNPVGGASDYDDLYGLGATLRITGGPTSGNPFLETAYIGQLAGDLLTMPTLTPAAGESLILAVAHREGAGTLTQPAGWTQTVYTTGGVVGGTQQVSWMQQATAAALAGLAWTVTAAAMSDMQAVTIRGGTSGSSLTASIIDTLTITDTSSPQTVAVYETAADPVATTDTAAATIIASRAVADPAGLADTTTTTQGLTRATTDILAVADSPAIVQQAARTITDTLNLTDSISTSLTPAEGSDLTRHIEDLATATDTAIHSTSRPRASEDTAGIQDSAAAAQSAVRTMGDDALLADTITTSLTATRPVSDQLALTDAVTGKLISVSGWRDIHITATDPGARLTATEPVPSRITAEEPR